jgi:hypothetical protein
VTLNAAALGLAKFAADHLAVTAESGGNKWSATDTAMTHRGFASMTERDGDDD